MMYSIKDVSYMMRIVMKIICLYYKVLHILLDISTAWVLLIKQYSKNISSLFDICSLIVKFRNMQKYNHSFVDVITRMFGLSL